MFQNLSERLGQVLTRLTKRGALSASDVAEAMREVRVALLEADVALPVVKDFIDKVSAEAVGEKVIKSVTPGQMVVKIVHDALVEMLGGTAPAEGVDLAAPIPVAILMVGLQGSGKTTTTAKIANRLMTKNRKKVLLVSLDTYRPAAQEQLAILGRQVAVETLPIVSGQMPIDIAKRGLDEARKGGFDVVMFDTAGRTTVDDEMMAEVAALRDLIKPHEVLLVSDAMIGQDAVATAKAFNDRLAVTGIVLTRVDGDARGGAALSMRAVTGKPIKLIGVGEKVDALDVFDPSRIAGRILGMGDIVSLVERAAETVDKEEAERVALRMMEGQFDFNDMLSQIRQVQKMGDLKGLMGMIPGLSNALKQAKGLNVDDKVVKRQEAMILSMTPKERRNPDLIKASRKQRIATGSGMSVADVNKLLKQHADMSTMMKRIKKMGGPSAMGAMINRMGGLPGLQAPRGPGGPPMFRR
ncbi:MAG: signal recognition particle protein [Alphaproteobacteria bacterium]|nr:signal recognition particle protein [Alphaproteobacteria bacterium]